MKHIAKTILALLLVFLAGCQLVQEAPVPPRPTEQVYRPQEAPEAMAVADFYDWMKDYLDMSLYTQGELTADTVFYTLAQPRKYPLDYTLTVEGQVFALPVTFAEMEASGWNIEVERADAEMGPERAIEATWRNDAGKRIIVRAGNPGPQPAAYRDCPLYRMRLILRNTDDDYEAVLASAPAVEFLGLDGGADLSAVLEKLGAPTEVSYGLAKSGRLNWLELRFQNGERDYLRLRFRGDGTALTEVEYSVDPL